MQPETTRTTGRTERDAPPLGVLHVAAPGAIGGLERIVQMLAAGQAAAGHEVSVAAILDRGREADHPFLALLDEAGTRVHPVVLPPRAYRRERGRVADLVGAESPDVVHTHGYRPDVVDGGVARKLGVPTVTTVHGFTGGGWKNRVYERLQRAAFRRFDAVVAVSRPLASELEGDGIAGSRLHVIPNAWGTDPPFLDAGEARRRLGSGPEGFHLGWVGRLSHEKGPDVLVDALPFLRSLPVHVSFVGTGRRQDALRSRAGRAGVEDRITWHGAVPQAVRYFRGFDAFVLSSRTEGTPVVLFEAMAAGVPVVATRVGGVPDVLSSNEAWLVPPEDPAALAQAVRAVFEDPEEAGRRARAAKARLQRDFSREAWVESYDRLYRSLLGSGAERAS